MLARQLSSTLTNDRRAFSADKAVLLPTYVALLNEFQPKSGGIFSADRVELATSTHYSSVATCIRGMLPLASLGSDTLDSSVCSLLALYYGLLHGNAELIRLARSVYTVALNKYSRRLGSAISRVQSGVSNSYQAFMCASFALQLFEYLNDVELYGTGQLAHIDGALEMLRSCTPRLIQESPGTRKAFSGFRGIVAFVAIERRTPSFLADFDWLHLPYHTTRKTIRDHLNDLGLQVPAFLKSADDVLSGAHISMNAAGDVVDQSLRLLNEMSSLQRDFERWIFKLKIATPGPLYWSLTDPIVEPPDFRDAECNRKYTNDFHQLGFSCGPVAGLLVHCWSFQLELLMSRVETQEAVLRHSRNDRTDSLSLPMTIQKSLARDRAKAEETAQLILQAEPYIGSCFEGLLCIQPPLKIAARYFKQYSSSLKQFPPDPAGSDDSFALTFETYEDRE